ncbi:hypothetical protein [Arsenophonus endosymbiont of Bemisia tabaci]|uniref:hypothetical protein n=1 Tax=Arsenophonus endosymbiont of Bemisia tabaci TaxID=536059 RepID=UPI0015F360D0|nr:hypothetical protein [Arsenophonus endosymbiont of Bemisia tabaci]
MQKKSTRMRHRYFVRTQYRVIKIKSLSYNWKIQYLIDTLSIKRFRRQLCYEALWLCLCIYS